MFVFFFYVMSVALVPTLVIMMSNLFPMRYVLNHSFHKDLDIETITAITYIISPTKKSTPQHPADILLSTSSFPFKAGKT